MSTGVRRSAAVRRAAGWGVAFRIVSAAASVAIVPLAARTLDKESFALWLVLWTLIAVLAPLDLGVGAALVTRVASLRGAGDSARAAEAVRAALAVLAAMAVVVALGGALLLHLVGGNSLLGGGGHTSTTTAVLVLVLTVAVNLPLGLGPKLLQAHHRFDLVARIGIVANVLQVVAGLVANVLDLGLVAFVMVALSATLLTNGFAFMRAMSGQALPPPARALNTEFKYLLRRAPLFWGLGLSAAVAFEADALVISHVVGVASAAAYSVPARLLLFVPGVLMLGASGFWPAVADARSVGDLAWARHQLKRMIRRHLVLGGLGALVVGTLMRRAVDLLAPGVGTPSWGLIGALVAVSVTHSVSIPVAMYMSGADLVGAELAVAATMTMVNIGLSIALAERIGSVGPPLATVTCQGVTVMLSLWVIRRADTGALG